MVSKAFGKSKKTAATLAFMSLQPYIKNVQETAAPSTLFLTRSPFCSVLVLCSLSHGSMIGCHGKARLSLCSSSLGNFSERSAKGGL